MLRVGLANIMQPQLERRLPSSERTLMAALVVLLLVAQCLAVAHYHPKQSTSLCSSAAASLDDGLCTLCLFHQYAPTVATAAPVPFSPTMIGHIDLYAAQSWPLYAFNSYLLGRSPPGFA